MLLFMACLALTWTSLGLAEEAKPVVLTGAEDAAVAWRSKLTGHKLIETEREGKQVKAVQMTYDLTKPPGYDWVRAVVQKGIDVRPYRYLSFWIKGDGSGAILMPILIRNVPQEGSNQFGEQSTSAPYRSIALNFTGWRQLYTPLADFENLPMLAAGVEQFNLSLTPAEGKPNKGVFLIGDIRLTTEPEGEAIVEAPDAPGRVKAVGDEADFFSLMDLQRPELAEVRKAVEAKDWKAAKQAWANHLSNRTSPRWLWSHRDKQRICEVYDKQYGGFARYKGSADQVLARDFNWLGVRKKLEKDVEWLQGPVEWTHVLSRFEYWRNLGYAYWGTGDKAYPEDFAYMLENWVAKNPVPARVTNSRGTRGSVWRTLEAGIRGDNWFDFMELFMDAPAFDAEAKYQMTKSLVEHGRYLYSAETRFNYGNWQVVECTGLAEIGIMLPEFKESAGWRDRAFKYLVEHMNQDVYPDGAHHEVTPGYHGWVMEQFLRVATVAKNNGYEIPGLMDRHEKMYEFLMDISMGHGWFPPLGDAGTGGSCAGSMATGALLYNRPDMRYLGLKDPDARWIWLFGLDAAERYANMKSAPPSFTSSMMPSAKYCVMRTGWEAKDRALFFDCAPWGGGHSHQDRLQVLCYAGRSLLIDSGMYSYDQPLSGSYLRKSVAHNVLMIDGAEQPQSDPEVLSWELTREAEFAAGRITGGGLTHQRSVLWVKPDYWVVVDNVFGTGQHELTRLFHFPLVEVKTEGKAVRSAFPTDMNIQVLAADDAALEMRKGWYPTGGATAEPSPVAAYINHATLPATLCAVLSPFSDAKQLPKVETVAGTNPLASQIRVTFADGQVDEIAIASAPADLQIGANRAHARALMVRKGPQANSVAVIDGDLLREN
ncbi:MAG: heparinase II/III family protein [Armatimonadia bacterium]